MNIGDLKHATAIGLGMLSIALATALPASADEAQRTAQQPRVQSGSAQHANGSLRPMQRFTDLLASAATQSSERSAETGHVDDPVAREPTPQLNETAPPPAEQVEERAMQPVKPPPATINTRAASPAPRSTFAQLDGDGDGRVSAAEAQAAGGFQADFKALDVDADGYLSDREFRAGDSGERNDRAAELEERDDGI